MKHTVLNYIIAAFSVASASAVPIEWTVSSGGNGHFYEAVAVPGGLNWLSARSQAEARGGYLATITSAAENTFVHSLIASDSQFWSISAGDAVGPWLGGIQPAGSPEPGGGWSWITGEPFVYQNWSPGEPNNISGDDRLHFYGPGNNNFANTWNDVPASFILPSFIVESVPEPGTGALCAVSLIVFAFKRRQRAWRC